MKRISNKKRIQGSIVAVLLLLVGFMIGWTIPRHQHHWVEVSKSYQPGVHITSVKWIDPDYLDRLLYGRTIIRYRCTVDGEEKTETFTGEIK